MKQLALAEQLKEKNMKFCQFYTKRHSPDEVCVNPAPPILDKGEICIKLGGHCWEMQNSVLLSNPPQYIRICKHCGKKQTGTSQPEIRWG
jgi:hypothetical protein